MSMKAYRWAKKQGGLTSAEKFVLVMLADYYNDAWSRAWPSLKTLAGDTALSVSTVQRALRGLQEIGIVAAERWTFNDGGAQMNNRYLLPTFDPSSRPAFYQPVLAFAADDNDFNWDGMTQIPGSNLFVDQSDLSPYPSEALV